jgi:hypothetical protein
MKLEVREYKLSDKFYSEYLYSSIFSKLGLTSSRRLTKMTCRNYGSDDEFDITDFLENKKESDLVIVCLLNNKIVGISVYELDINCNLKEKCFDTIILNTYLCYEKSIITIKDVKEFLKKSLPLVEKYYKPYYEMNKKIIKSTPEYTNIKRFDMYIVLTRDQVPYFDKDIYDMYKKLKFDDEQRHGMMFYMFTNSNAELHKIWREQLKNKQISKSKSRSRSRSRSRSKK